MRGKDVFTKKKVFDLEKAIPLTEVETSFSIQDFEVYYSKKYNSEFTVIETTDGRLLQSWSKVIGEKFNQLADLTEEDWQGMELKVVERDSQSGRKYVDLEIVE